MSEQTWSERWFPKHARPSVERSPQITVALLVTGKRSRAFTPGYPGCFHTRWPATGEEEGDTCGRDGCVGVLQMTNPEASLDDSGCTCFIAPPCGHCMATRPNCPDCGWAMEAP